MYDQDVMELYLNIILFFTWFQLNTTDTPSTTVGGQGAAN